MEILHKAFQKSHIRRHRCCTFFFHLESFITNDAWPFRYMVFAPICGSDNRFLCFEAKKKTEKNFHPEIYEICLGVFRSLLMHVSSKHTHHLISERRKPTKNDNNNNNNRKEHAKFWH